MSATVTWLESLWFEVTYTSWASGPGLAAGPTKQGHSVLLGLTNQPSKWKSSSNIQSWFSPARVKLFKLMEGFAALALAPVPEDHWQHSVPLFHSSTSQRIELEKKKIKGKIPTLWRHKIKSMLLTWSQLAFHTLKCQTLPLQAKVRTDKDDSGWPDVILTSKVITLMFD